MPALRDAVGAAGLVFIDGHEDATPMELSPNGEAANMEIGMLLGLTGEALPGVLRTRLPALQPDRLAMLGQRDDTHRHQLKISTLADRVLLHTCDEISVSPGKIAQETVAYIATRTRG